MKGQWYCFPYIPKVKETAPFCPHPSIYFEGWMWIADEWLV